MVTSRRRTIQRAQAKRPVFAPGTSLGDLSPEVEELDVTFGWFGEDIRVNPELSELDIIDFAESAMHVDEDSEEAITLIKRTMRLYIHADDFDRFWALSSRKRVRVETLMLTMNRITELVSGRPTGPLSDSSPGQPTTVESLKEDSSSRAMRRLESEGRPDLALVVVQRQEALATA